jgi:hypothetical protein
MGCRDLFEQFVYLRAMDARPLSAEDRRELERRIGDGLEMLGRLADFPEDTDDSELVLAAIGRCLQRLRSKASAPERAALAALWGDEQRRARAFTWVRLGDALGLISPDRETAIRPDEVVEKLLAD